LIEKGYEFESESPWSSAYHFLQASTILQSKAKGYYTNHPKTNDDSYYSYAALDFKHHKVAALYEDQSNAYLIKARKVLLEAMQKECDCDEISLENIPSRVQAVKLLHGEIDDNGNGNDNLNMDTNQYFEPFMNLLDSEEIQKRRMLFEKLFIPLKEEKIESETETTGTGTRTRERHAEIEAAKEFSLEERLAMLNSSIPKPKSHEQRMRELHSSLSGLGVSLPTSSKDDARKILNGNHNHHVSEQDQLDEILNMAQDEALLDLDNENGEHQNDSRDVMQILKNSSIRIDLDPDPDIDHDSHSTRTPRSQENDTDAELNFWKNLQIDDDDDDQDRQPMSRMDEIKHYLSTAQSLLLQASICLEEMDEQGIDLHFNCLHVESKLDGDTEMIPVLLGTKDTSEEANVASTVDEMDSAKEKRDAELSSHQNGTSGSVADDDEIVNHEEKPNVETSIDDDSNAEECGRRTEKEQDEENDATKDFAKPFIEAASPLVGTGRGNLQEAQELISKAMSIWPSISTPPLKDALSHE